MGNIHVRCSILTAIFHTNLSHSKLRIPSFLPSFYFAYILVASFFPQDFSGLLYINSAFCCWTHPLGICCMVSFGKVVMVVRWSKMYYFDDALYCGCLLGHLLPTHWDLMAQINWPIFLLVMYVDREIVLAFS